MQQSTHRQQNPTSSTPLEKQKKHSLPDIPVSDGFILNNEYDDDSLDSDIGCSNITIPDSEY